MQRDGCISLQPARHIFKYHLAYNRAGGHQAPEVLRLHAAKGTICDRLTGGGRRRMPYQNGDLAEGIAFFHATDVHLAAVAVGLERAQLAAQHDPEIDLPFSAAIDYCARWDFQYFDIAKTSQ